MMVLDAPRASRRNRWIFRTAAALAASAAINRYRTGRAERAHPPRGRFVEIDGLRLHLRDAGVGRPVVLIHGNMLSSADFVLSGVVDRLAAHHRVLAFDRPGFGWSPRPRDRAWDAAAQADLLLRAWRRLGIDRPIVVAHSYGATVAAALALNHPGAVSGAVLLGGYFYPTPRADIGVALPTATPILGDLLRHTVSPLVGQALMPMMERQMFAPCPVPAAMSRELASGLYMRPAQIGAISQDAVSMISAAAAMQPRYREMRLPLVLMAGTEDRVVTPAMHSLRLATELTGAALRLVPGVGHMLHHADPDAVVAAVAEVSRPPALPR